MRRGTKKSWANGSAKSAALRVSLAAGLLLQSFGTAVYAKESRAAIVVDVEGTVMVAKEGGSAEFRAFPDMSLGQGDRIRTESGSTITLRISDQGDEVVVGENTELALSSLVSADDGSKTSKLKMWAGSLWFKVKKLVNADDRFEVETPTAVMGVRGSNGYIEMKFGQLFALMASGVLATKPTNGTGQTAFIYPGQQITLLPDGAADPSANVTPVDIGAFVASAPPDVIRKVIASIMVIREENEQLVQNIASGARPIDPGTGLALDSADALNAFSANLTHLLAHIAKAAIERNLMPESEVRQFVDESNRKFPENPIDLDNVPPFDPTAGLDPAAADRVMKRLDQIRQERKRQLEEEKWKEEEKKRDNAELFERLQALSEAVKEENRKALEEKEKKAEEKYVSGLTPEERERFEADKQEAERQKRQQEEARAENENPGTLPANPGTGGGTGGSTGEEPDGGVDTTAPTATLLLNQGDAVTHDPAVLLYMAPSEPVVSYKAAESLADLENRPWLPYQSPAVYQLERPDEGGTRTVYVKLKDAAGNESDVTSDSIDYVPQPGEMPGGTFTINGDQAVTASSQVVLNYTSPPGAVAAMFSENKADLEQETGTWHSIAAPSGQFEFALSAGAGDKTVYMMFKDGNGVKSAIAHDSIVYDPSAKKTVLKSTPSSLANLQPFETFQVEIALNGFRAEQANSIYAVEVELEYDPYVEAQIINGAPAGDVFPGNAVQLGRPSGSRNGKTLYTYAATKYNDGSPAGTSDISIDSASPLTLVTIPFMAGEVAGSGTIAISKVRLVDHEGRTVGDSSIHGSVQIDNPVISFTVGGNP